MKRSRNVPSHLSCVEKPFCSFAKGIKGHLPLSKLSGSGKVFFKKKVRKKTWIYIAYIAEFVNASTTSVQPFEYVQLLVAYKPSDKFKRFPSNRS